MKNHNKQKRRASGAQGLACVALALALGGCAISPDRRDPFENYNRKITQFNDRVDSVVLKPVAMVYRQAVPPLARTGVSNFFGNLSDAWSAVNSLAQLKVHHAAESSLRFAFNSFFGMAGVLDIASEMGIDRHREDFGQTLGRWGVPTGPYVVLPLLGPSTLRDTLALPVDMQGDPVRRFGPEITRDALHVLRAVNARSNLLRVSSVLDEAALDKYTFTRDAYLQRRRAEVFEEGRGGDDGSDSGSTPDTVADGPAAGQRQPDNAPTR